MGPNIMAVPRRTITEVKCVTDGFDPKITQEIRSILNDKDLNSLSLRDVREQVEASMQLSPGTLDKEQFKKTVTSILSENNDSEEEESVTRTSQENTPKKDIPDSDCDSLISGSDDEEPIKNRRQSNGGKSKFTKAKKRKQEPVQRKKEGTGGQTEKNLREMAKVMRVGPTFYMKLKGMEGKQRLKRFAEMLKEKGAEFKGLCPTKLEIARVRRAKEREMDLDGIDRTAILDGPRGRRRCREGADQEQEEIERLRMEYARTSNKNVAEEQVGGSAIQKRQVENKRARKELKRRNQESEEDEDDAIFTNDEFQNTTDIQYNRGGKISDDSGNSKEDEVIGNKKQRKMVLHGDSSESEAEF